MLTTNEMNADEAIAILQKIREQKAKVWRGVTRKRWRDSEKALTRAALSRDIIALDKAVQCMMVAYAR